MDKSSASSMITTIASMGVLVSSKTNSCYHPHASGPKVIGVKMQCSSVYCSEARCAGEFFFHLETQSTEHITVKENCLDCIFVPVRALSWEAPMRISGIKRLLI